MTGRELLIRAIESEPVPRDLPARVRSRLDYRNWTLGPLLGAALACVGFLFAFTQVYSISMLRIGLSDHVHCGIGGLYPKQTDASEMAAGVGPQFAPLIQPVIQQASLQKNGALRLISAHQCSVGNRQFVHFVFEGPDGLTSVSLTKRRPLEWIPGNQHRRTDGYSVSAFEQEEYLVFVSSQKPKQELAEAFGQILSYRL